MAAVVECPGHTTHSYRSSAANAESVGHTQSACCAFGSVIRSFPFVCVFCCSTTEKRTQMILKEAQLQVHNPGEMLIAWPKAIAMPPQLKTQN